LRIVNDRDDIRLDKVINVEEELKFGREDWLLKSRYCQHLNERGSFTI
jgi:hypothetical protein